MATRQMKFAGAAKILGDASFEGDKIVISNQKEITILISLATSFVDFKSMPTANAFERAMARFENIKPYKLLLEEHIADFSSLLTEWSLISAMATAICRQTRD